MRARMRDGKGGGEKSVRYRMNRGDKIRKRERESNVKKRSVRKSS